MSESFDKRLTPARPDLAARHLEGKVEAARFVDGRRMQVKEGVADLKREPRPDARLDTQALYGETVIVYDDEEGWSWVQLERDSYVGWIAANVLWSRIETPTHRVCVPRTFVFPRPEIKDPPLLALPLGADVEIVGERDKFLIEAGSGFLYRPHLTPREARVADFVAMAESLIGAPYLWGGKSWLGVDCSGLVQTSLAMAGIEAPRDTDLQEKGLGRALAEGEPLRRGDLVFWKGHVGIMQDAERLLHANAFHLQVASEPFAPARERILASGSAVTSVRRLIE